MVERSLYQVRRRALEYLHRAHDIGRQGPRAK